MRVRAPFAWASYSGSMRILSTPNLPSSVSPMTAASRSYAHDTEETSRDSEVLEGARPRKLRGLLRRVSAVVEYLAVGSKTIAPLGGFQNAP